jgi:hypothetical protein
MTVLHPIVVSPLHQFWELQYEHALKQTESRKAGARQLFLVDRYAKKNENSAVQDGHRKMDTIRKYLNMFSRSYHQKLMHTHMMQTILALVYGKAVLAEHELEILEYNNFTHLGRQEVVITAARRMGKSYSVAMFCAAVVYTVPGIEISIFSSSARAAGGEVGLMSLVRKFLEETFKLSKELIAKSNEEHLFLKFGEGDLRKINSYPASTHTYVYKMPSFRF